jgi:hypothetical protein
MASKTVAASPQPRTKATGSDDALLPLWVDSSSSRPAGTDIGRPPPGANVVSSTTRSANGRFGDAADRHAEDLSWPVSAPADIQLASSNGGAQSGAVGHHCDAKDRRRMPGRPPYVQQKTALPATSVACCRPVAHSVSWPRVLVLGERAAGVVHLDKVIGLQHVVVDDEVASAGDES